MTTEKNEIVSQMNKNNNDFLKKIVKHKEKVNKLK